MKLIINTTDNNFINLKLVGAKKTFAMRVSAYRKQGEKLLVSIDKLLTKNNFKLKDLKQIEVVNGEGSFSSLRIGIATANALGYALNIPVCDQAGKFITTQGINIVEPEYTAEANIGPKKK